MNDSLFYYINNVENVSGLILFGMWFSIILSILSFTISIFFFKLTKKMLSSKDVFLAAAKIPLLLAFLFLIVSIEIPIIFFSKEDNILNVLELFYKYYIN